ncbi:MAG: UDP-3-O-(3-hydroxymyristoyl)glucosamine N-acyltransferase [Candidatus Marinimicrobia bacterium]|nr:UDP-3-O-(3-hydroxymyristoyl)glucosamine N-acyltransferase [Candidatus Neomarinimicrobiota bacterium]
MEFSLGQILKIVDGTLEGDEASIITDLAEIQHAKKGQLTFLGNPKYNKYLSTTEATAVLVPKDFKGSYENLIRVENPNLAFSLMIPRFRPELPLPNPEIHKTAFIANSAQLGENIYIGPNVIIEDKAVIENNVFIFANSYIGTETRIGSETIIRPNVTIYHNCQIGSKVLIHSGVVVGSDGFGFVRTEKSIKKIPQAGRVVIGDNVEIGANCSIDRGTLGDTVISKGTKLDNLIQVAHNVKIGEYCFIAAQSGIAGSSTIEDRVTIAGQVGVAGHLKIGEGAIVAAQSGVSKDVPPGTIVFGYPAQEQKKARREIANIRSIPDIKAKLKEIEKIIEESK